MCGASTSACGIGIKDLFSTSSKMFRICYYVRFGLILLFVSKSHSNCIRTADRMLKPVNPFADYVIEISGNPAGYVPEETYIITLKPAAALQYTSRFKEFALTVEHENYDTLGNLVVPSVGYFELMDDMMTKFSISCRNTVIQTNKMMKSSVQVRWKAPSKNSGCVVIKATVVESEDNWYDSTGNLSKVLCEEQSENKDVQPDILTHCCACHEAKYEVAFQGTWSRNTHPKGFPSDSFKTKFSDIIGSSHQLGNSFWDYGGFASEGLKELAETGITASLERELKEKSDQIRTIIKARELSYPNITGTSYTVFRVDRKNHLVSLVSKITPSPDWVVGVSNLELCLRNCSWVESRTLNLYPWDVGTDDGIAYDSPDAQSQIPQPIKLIKSNSPNNEESPFFNQEGQPIKPLARLHITREKLYEKVCSDDDYEDSNCETTPWSKWSPCSNKCVKTRTREYVNPDTAGGCKNHLEEEKRCMSHHCKAEKEDPRCETEEWSEWSSCSKPCGKGVQTRDRQLKQPQHEKFCTSNGMVELQENMDCEGGAENCEGNEEPSEDCPDTTWDEWSACSVSCGNGTKQRVRISNIVNKNEHSGDEEGSEEKQTCADVTERVECYNSPCEDEDAETTTEDQYGTILTGNLVATSTLPLVFSEGPYGLPVLDCKVSKWSMWTRCNATEPCKKGYQFRERHIKRHSQNGGKPCPEKLLKKKRCKVPCDQNESRSTLPTWGPTSLTEAQGMINRDCVMGSWSAWSPCSRICGSSAVQIRTRGIKVPPLGNGMTCLHRKEERKCPLPLACTNQGLSPFYQ